jgi:hypothetical protein
MGWCKVGENEGAKAIADLILFNTSIATLDLRGNSLNNPGGAPASALQEASAASPVVVHLPSPASILQKLSLWCCESTPRTVTSLIHG